MVVGSNRASAAAAVRFSRPKGGEDQPLTMDRTRVSCVITPCPRCFRHPLYEGSRWRPWIAACHRVHRNKTKSLRDKCDRRAKWREGLDKKMNSLLSGERKQCWADEEEMKMQQCYITEKLQVGPKQKEDEDEQHSLPLVISLALSTTAPWLAHCGDTTTLLLLRLWRRHGAHILGTECFRKRCIHGS